MTDSSSLVLRVRTDPSTGEMYVGDQQGRRLQGVSRFRVETSADLHRTTTLTVVVEESPYNYVTQTKKVPASKFPAKKTQGFWDF